MENKDNTQNSKRPFKPPEWLNRQAIILLIIATIFLSTLILSDPFHITGNTTSLTPVGMSISEDFTPTPTLLPEWEENRSQTDGIVIFGTILVVIVIGGTYAIIRQKS